LEGHGLGGHESGGVDQLGGGVELAFGVDDLGTGFALGFGLFGHGAEHGFGHVDLLDFDGDDFYAEGRGVAVDDGLDALVEGLAVGEEFIKVDLAEDRAECRLGELGGLVDVVCDLDDGFGGVDDAQGDNGVHLEGDVVLGDDVLGRDLHGFLTERDADDLVERAEDEDDAGALGGRDAAEAEDDAPLVFFEDFDGVDDVENDDGDDDECWERHGLENLDGAIVTECGGDHGFTRMRVDGRRKGLTPICTDDTDVGGFSAVAWRVGRISGLGSGVGSWVGLSWANWSKSWRMMLLGRPAAVSWSYSDCGARRPCSGSVVMSSMGVVWVA